MNQFDQDSSITLEYTARAALCSHQVNTPLIAHTERRIGRTHHLPNENRAALGRNTIGYSTRSSSLTILGRMPPATFQCTIANAGGFRLMPKHLTRVTGCRKMPYQRLEPCASKGACTVLRGPSAGNRVRLPDHYDHYAMRRAECLRAGTAARSRTIRSAPPRARLPTTAWN